MSLSKVQENPKEKTFPVLVTTTKFVLPANGKIDTRGTNKIYESKRSRSYFIEIDKQMDGFSLTLHTNDKVNTQTNIYQSMSKYPNKKYCVSLLLTQFFKSQRVIPKRVQHQYFKMIRNRLYERYEIIRKRLENHVTNNRKTKTFFNFTYKRYRFRFGIYQPCNCTTDNNQCNLPVPYVMSRPHKDLQRLGCYEHAKTIKIYSKRPNILNNNEYNEHPRILGDNLERAKKYRKEILSSQAIISIHDKWQKKKLKRINSNRLGTSYVIRYEQNTNVSNRDRNLTSYYKKVYRDWKPLENKEDKYTARTIEKQEERCERKERLLLLSYRKIEESKNRDRKLQDHEIFRCSKYINEQNAFVTKNVKHVTYRSIRKYPSLYGYVPKNYVQQKKVEGDIVSEATKFNAVRSGSAEASSSKKKKKQKPGKRERMEIKKKKEAEENRKKKGERSI